MADGSIGYLPAADDLVLQAAALLRKVRAPGASSLIFRLSKHVPLAAGLGGGSADAAAALDLAAGAWGLDLTDDERRALAARLGSDVPFFAVDVDAALVTGRGESVEPLPGPLDPVGVLLVTSGQGLVTRAVFESWTALDASAGDAAHDAEAALAARDLAAHLAAGCSGSDVIAMAARLRDANDLWPAAVRLRPDLADLRLALETQLDRTRLLSGSGPTFVALYPSRAAADAAATLLRSDPASAVPDAAIRTATFERTITREA
jgi:4-diphosphocytidyl-2-C-methyl-D-erythritol kinase